MIKGITTLHGNHGRARRKFGTLMFEHEVFQKQMYYIEESAYDIFGTFQHPLQIFGAPRHLGNYTPLPPLIMPLVLITDIATYSYSLLCKKKHDKFEKSIVSVRLNACPVYVDEHSLSRVSKGKQGFIKRVYDCFGQDRRRLQLWFC